MIVWLFTFIMTIEGIDTKTTLEFDNIGLCHQVQQWFVGIDAEVQNIRDITECVREGDAV